MEDEIYDDGGPISSEDLGHSMRFDEPRKGRDCASRKW